MRKWIRKQFKRRPHPLAFFWRWAKRGKRRGEVKRWRALKNWAAHREEAARKRHDYPAMRKWHRIRVVYRRQMRRKIRWLKDHSPESPPKAAGTTLIDGRAVPNWMVPKLKEIRARGRWRGYVISGFRTPEYSESLCYHICGRPSCSGTCAGRASNHACPPSATCQPFEGAIDVTYPIDFAAEAHAVGAPFFNALPFDRPHFSHSGR
jgi:hypothetical protein